jgi:hypothetical protein
VQLNDAPNQCNSTSIKYINIIIIYYECVYSCGTSVVVEERLDTEIKSSAIRKLVNILT